MIRSIQLNNTTLQYLGSSPKSVSICLHGSGERGIGLVPMETKIPFLTALSKSLVTENRIVLVPQLPAGAGGWYSNWTSPVIAYAKTFKLPIDINGWSLGGMGTSDNIYAFPGVFRSAMTAPGKCEGFEVASYRSIPSQHWYDPADKTIDYGYASIKDLVTTLQGEGKTDISLTELPGKGHDVWDTAYLAANYWAWLDSLDIPVVPVDHIFVNGIDTKILGPIISTEIRKV